MNRKLKTLIRELWLTDREKFTAPRRGNQLENFQTRRQSLLNQIESPRTICISGAMQRPTVNVNVCWTL